MWREFGNEMNQVPKPNLGERWRKSGRAESSFADLPCSNLSHCLHWPFTGPSHRALSVAALRPAKRDLAAAWERCGEGVLQTHRLPLIIRRPAHGPIHGRERLNAPATLPSRLHRYLHTYIHAYIPSRQSRRRALDAVVTVRGRPSPPSCGCRDCMPCAAPSPIFLPKFAHPKPRSRTVGTPKPGSTHRDWLPPMKLLRTTARLVHLAAHPPSPWIGPSSKCKPSALAACSTDARVL